MKVSLFGHFGSSNWGNEGTLLAMLAHLRRVFPNCEISCVCTNPEVVAAREAIEAIAISTRVVSIRLDHARLHKRLRTAFVGVSAELRQYVRAFHELRYTDMLIIPGTGLLTDAYGLSGWGPHNLFKWCLMARLRGCQVLFVSVGVGPVYGRLGRVLVKSALSLASYRSYRDHSSVDCLSNIGFNTKHDQIYPDLAFSLPTPPVRCNGTGGKSRRVVGIGLMLYAGKYSVANPHDATYKTYLESLAVLAQWLLRHDYDIRLLMSDGDDGLALREFTAVLEARIGTRYEGRISHDPPTSVDHVLSQIASTDIVIATRFHNALYAMLLSKPVIAISFHQKCTSLMYDMGLSQYCHDINAIDAKSLVRTFLQLERDRERLKRMTAERVETARTILDEQYGVLFKRLCTLPSTS